jgi:3-oxoacyl-[acyl-carrier-protein] synthase II
MSEPSAIAGAAVLTAAELERPAVAELLAGERLRAVSLESRLLLAAARLALRDARERTGGPAPDADALGVVVATRHAGLHDYVEQAGLTAPAAEVSIRLPAAGPNATVSNGAVGGLDALRYAADRIAAGDARAVLVCEVDVTPDVARPAPADEGTEDPPPQRAAVAVLEHAPALRARGATPCALVGAVATAFAPSGDTAAAQARAVDEVLEAGGGEVAPEEVAVGGALAADRGEVTPGEPASPPGDAGPVVQLAAAALRFARGEAHAPQLLQARDAWSAGAVVIHPDPETER